MPSERLGVVLLIPGEAAVEIDGLRRACGDTSLGRVPPHITLVPPVNVRADRLDEAVGSVRAAGAALGRPLTLALGPAATFAPASPVLYLEVSGDLEQIMGLRDALAVGPLDRSLVWPFVPHVTLADQMSEERIAQAVPALADYRASVVIEAVHVLSEGRDRVWQPIADAALRHPWLLGRGGLPVEIVIGGHPDPEASRFLVQVGAGGGREPSRGGVPFVLTARREGRVVGLARGEIGGNGGTELRLESLIVSADVRRQGIGSHLLAVVERVGVERGCSGCATLAACTDAGDGAEAFLRARGWRAEAGSPQYMRSLSSR